MKKRWMAAFIASVALLGSQASQWANAAEINPEKPFAERHLVLQVSDNDAQKFSLALDITNNLIRHYGGPDYIDIEVITFAGGIHMLTDSNNANAERIQSLMASNVKFFVCLNTLDTVTRNTGKRPVLLKGVEGVQTGVAYLLDQVHRGYTPVHP